MAATVFTGSAGAATKFLYASPTGSTSGTNICTNQSDPCSLPNALANATDGTDLTVLPGTYNVGAISSTAVLFMHGLAGSPRPVIIASGSGTTAFKLGGAGGSLTHLDFQAGSGWGTVLEANFNLIEDITVTGIDISGRGLVMDPGPSSSPNLLRDSTVFVNTPSPSVVGIDVGGGSVAAGNADVRNVTTVETGTGAGGIGLLAHNQATPGSVAVTAENVIAEGNPNGVGATCPIAPGTASLAMDHSNFSGASPVLNGGCASATVTNRVSGTPLLANMANGDFHELPGSPTIDAGVDSFSNGANDPDGNLRTIGSATDVGAYEYAPPPSVTTLAPSSTTQSTAVLTGSVNPNGAPTNVSFVLDSGPGSPQTVSAGSVAALLSAQPVSQTVSGLTPGSTYTYHVHAVNSGGPADGGEVTFTTPAQPTPGGGAGGTPPPARPQLTQVSLTHRRFRVGRAPTAVNAAAYPRKAPVGTTFRFTLTTAATLKIVINHLAPGRRSHGRCVKPSRKLAHAKRCRRTVTNGTLIRHPAAGQGRVAFTGRIGRKPLPPGGYTAALTAVSLGGRSATVKVSFTVARG